MGKQNKGPKRVEEKNVNRVVGGKAQSFKQRFHVGSNKQGNAEDERAKGKAAADNLQNVLNDDASSYADWSNVGPRAKTNSIQEIAKSMGINEPWVTSENVSPKYDQKDLDGIPTTSSLKAGEWGTIDPRRGIPEPTEEEKNYFDNKYGEIAKDAYIFEKGHRLAVGDKEPIVSDRSYKAWYESDAGPQGKTSTIPQIAESLGMKLETFGASTPEDLAGLPTSPVKLDIASPEITAELAQAPIFKKSTMVEAEKVETEREVRTVLKDGTEETVNIAKPGDYVVTNPGGEQYVMSAEDFDKRYFAYEGSGWSNIESNVYQAKGSVRAIQNPTGQPITITAPWGEEQHWDERCYVVSTYDPADPNSVSGDRYIIGHDEFHETYAKWESSW